MKIITQPTKIVYFSPDILNRMNRLLQPTVEKSGARDYQINEIVAAGGQAVNAMDAYPGRFLTIPKELITGDDSTFASDTGNWDTSDAGVAIAGGKLDFNDIALGDGAEITVPVGTALRRFSITISDYSEGTIKIVSGGTDGALLNANGTFVENIAGVGGAVIRIEGVGIANTMKFDIITDVLTGDYRIDVITNRRGTYDFVVVDGQNMLDAYGGALAQQIELYHNTVDNFSTATKVTGLKQVSGLLGENAPAADFDGVDDVGSAADDPNLTFGTGAFTVEYFGKIGGFFNQGSSINTILGKGTLAAANSFGFSLISSNVLRFEVNGTAVVSDLAISLTDDVYLVGRRDASGNLNLFVNAIQQADTAVETGDVDNASNFYVGRGNVVSRFTREAAKNIKLYNYARSDNDIVGRAGDDEGEQLQELSDFTGGVDNWSRNTGATLVLSAPETGGVTADMLKCFANGGDIGMQIRDDASVLDPAFNYRITFDYYADAGSGLANLGMGQGSARWGTGNVPVVEGAIQTGEIIEFTPNTGETITKITAFTTAGGATTDNLLNGKAILFKNVRIDKIGVVASYTAAGLSESQGMWFDDTANSNDMTLSGVEYQNTPTDNGFYFLEFEPVTNALFWFVQFNSGGVIALEDGQIGHITIGKKVDIDRGISLGFGGSYDRGISARETESGRLLVEQLFGSQPGYSVQYTKMADKAKFDALLALVTELKNSLYPLYMSFDYDIGLPTVQRVRIVGRVTWKCNILEGDQGASYDLSYKLETDLN